MPRPEIERMTIEQKAAMCEHFVRTGDGLGVEEACMLEGDFVAKLFLPAELGTPENAPRTYQALADLAAAEAEDLELRQRGMRPAQKDPNMQILGDDDPSPAADGLFRIGAAPVIVQEPSCMIWFPGAYAVDPWTLRTFSRLAAQAAAEIAASYPEAGTSRSATRRPGPARAAVAVGVGEAAEPSIRADAGTPLAPPSRVKAARQAFVDADPGYQDDTVPEPEGEYPPPPPEDRGAPPPPPSAAERARGRGAPPLRQGPLSAGVGGEGMPAKPIEPIQPRIHSRHQR